MSKSCIFKLLTLGFVFFWLPSQAQDVIITQENEEIIAEITAVKKYSIIYQTQAQKGAQKMLKKDIYKVIYQDGMQQYFSTDIPAIMDSIQAELASENYAGWEHQGKKDGKIYYDNPNLIYATLIPTVVPFFGVFTAIAVGGIVIALPANPRLDQLPDQQLFFENEAYREGYVKGARAQRLRRCLQGIGIGLLVQGAVVIIILSSV